MYIISVKKKIVKNCKDGYIWSRVIDLNKSCLVFKKKLSATYVYTHIHIHFILKQKCYREWFKNFGQLNYRKAISWPKL